MSAKETIPPKLPRHSGVELRVFGGGMGDFKQGRRGAGAWDSGESGVAEEEPEEVVRLDSESIPLANRRIENEQPKVPVPIREARKLKLKIGLRGLTILMAGVAVFLTVAVVLGVGAMKEDGPEPVSYLESLKVIENQVDEPFGIENADELLESATALFDAYCAAETLDEANKMIRDSESISSELEAKWKPLGKVEGVLGEVSKSGEVIIVKMAGQRVKGGRFEYFLVLGDDGLKVDWAASEGLGDVPFDRLKKIPTGKSVKMRVLIERATFHPLDFPDDDFRSYRMHQLGDTGGIFAYARVYTDVVKFLSKAMNDGSVLLEEVRDLKVIVVLKNEGRGAEGQFTLTDVVTKGWVEP